MATPTTAPATRRSFSIVLFRILIIVGILAVVSAAGVAGWVYWIARRALPQVDGRVPISDIRAPVTILRDARGVPHIRAADRHDLFEAQGYATAQDRLWQMDATRRYARGELAEVFGPRFLEVDRRQRILQIRATAERMEAALSPAERADMEAYAQGVNACIAQQRKHPPLEFRLLGYAPHPWTVIDTISIALNMSEMLSPWFDTQVTNDRVIAKVGPEMFAQLHPQTSWRDHPPGEDKVSFGNEKPKNQDEEEEDEEEPARNSSVTHLLPPADIRLLDNLMDGGLAPGSNEWVVSGDHTTSGRPLLSNDMHLAHTIPNVWYEAQLEGGGFDVVGFTLPGSPYVVVGHNQRIAWGFTVLPADVHDLFAETFNAAGQYQTPSGWQQPEHRREVIHVKNAPDTVLDVVVTRHGPVVTPLIPGEGRQLALQWTIYDTSGLAMPFDELDSAQNWAEFRTAVSHISSPVLNGVYGDVDGHIGYQAVGRIPVRADGNGVRVENGADGAHDWKGSIPFEELPTVYDPPSGILATANNRTTPEGYKYFVTNEWFPPYRAERIYRVLDSGRKFSASDMLTLQTDIYSDFDRYCAERFVYAIDHAKNASARAHTAADLMRNWDGRLTMDSAAAAVEVVSRMKLHEMILKDKLGALYQEPTPGKKVPDMAAVALEDMLLHRPTQWLPKGYSDWDSLLVAAVEAAVKDPSAAPDLAHWRYGKEFPLYLQHPILGRVPVLKHWTGPGLVPQSGGTYTVKQVGRSFGPSERMTVDLANLDASTMNLVTGESGQVFSSHFMDQWSAWYQGTTFLMPFTDGAASEAARHTLVLEPAK